jgi:hypothetical protein
VKRTQTVLFRQQNLPPLPRSLVHYAYVQYVQVFTVFAYFVNLQSRGFNGSFLLSTWSQNARKAELTVIFCHSRELLANIIDEKRIYYCICFFLVPSTDTSDNPKRVLKLFLHQ